MKGMILIAGIGPGSRYHRTTACSEAIAFCDTVVGYHLYLEQIEDCLKGKTVIAGSMMQEKERCEAAVEQAQNGKRVCVVSGGDAGVYGMAGLVLEILAQRNLDIHVEVMPGITAASAACALLGAPLMHDFACISFSDRLTPQSLIEKRLRCALEADFSVCIYNPSSQTRHAFYQKMCAVILEYRNAQTPAGIVRHAFRDQQSVRIVCAEALPQAPVDMHTICVLGNSQTYVYNGKMITPRGYDLCSGS